MCLQPGHLNKTDHWLRDIGPSDIINSKWENSSQNLIETDRGKTVQESKSTKTDHDGETKTESLVEKLEVKLGLGDTSDDLVGKDMDVKKTMMAHQDQDVLDNQYRGIGNMVGQPV